MLRSKFLPADLVHDVFGGVRNLAVCHHQDISLQRVHISSKLDLEGVRFGASQTAGAQE